MTDPLKDPDRHKDPGVLARPGKDLRKAAQEVLTEHGWTMNDFLIACITLVTKNPKDMLRSLERHRPPPKKYGRPRKRPD